jgi:L-malate glycosyltransferase
MSKKIAIICNYSLFAQRIGGMDRFFVAFDQKLKSENYQVDWYFTDYRSFEFYKNLNIFSANGQEVTALFLNEIKKSQVKYDFLITHFVALCIPFFKKVKQLGVQKTVTVDHNPRPIEGFPLSKIIKNKIKGLIYSNYIDQFIGVSNYTKKHILKDYGFFLEAKTAVVYNGIQTEVFKKRVNENFGKFIVTSHLRPSKGIQDLIEAVAILPSDLQKIIKIDIYGEGPMEAELNQLVFNKNLQNIFSFKGSSSNLNNLFSNYSYMIQPTYMECFSLSILESLSANVPVITTTVGGNLEVLVDGKNSFIFEPKSISSLSSILQKIMNNEISVKTETFTNIEQNFNLEQMVENHFKTIVK